MSSDDCGQDGVCAEAPGCSRHWAERVREVMAERDAAKATFIDAALIHAKLIQERDEARAELKKTEDDFQSVFDSRDEVIEERERARQACNRYWHDLTRIALLCAQTDDEYPLKAVERVLKERDELLQRVETLRELADRAAYEQGVAQRRMTEAQTARDNATFRARRACQLLVEEVGVEGPADVDEVAERAAVLIRELRDKVSDLQAAMEESEHQMHLRVRAGYDKTIADSWRAHVTKIETERDSLAENLKNSAKQLKEALANSDACWKLEQEMYVRQRDEARAEVSRREREHEALVETAQKALANVASERDEARVEVERLRAALKHIAAGNISPAIDFARHVLDGAAGVSSVLARDAQIKMETLREAAEAWRDSTYVYKGRNDHTQKWLRRRADDMERAEVERLRRWLNEARAEAESLRATAWNKDSSAREVAKERDEARAEVERLRVVGRSLCNEARAWLDGPATTYGDAVLRDAIDLWEKAEDKQ